MAMWHTFLDESWVCRRDWSRSQKHRVVHQVGHRAVHMVAHMRHRWHRARVVRATMCTTVCRIMYKTLCRHIVAHTTRMSLWLHLHLTTNLRDMHGQALHGHTWYSTVTWYKVTRMSRLRNNMAMAQLPDDGMCREGNRHEDSPLQNWNRERCTIKSNFKAAKLRLEPRTSHAWKKRWQWYPYMFIYILYYIKRRFFIKRHAFLKGVCSVQIWQVNGIYTCLQFT